MNNPQEHIVILGNGIAGITAARHIRKLSEKKITVISAESDFFFSRTALMYVFMGHLTWKNIEPYERRFWEQNRIHLLKEYVERLDTHSKTLFLSNGNQVVYDKLILATGSISRKLDWPGINLKGVQGLISKQDLEILEERTKTCEKAVVVGGGLIGVELAEMLSTRNIEVSMLVREKSFWGNVLPPQDASLVSREIQSHGIQIFHKTELKEIKGRHGRLHSVLTSSEEELPCQLVGLSIGVRPNIDFLRDSEVELRQGILVNEYLQTNVPDVYAAGDCVEQRRPLENRNPVEAVWYTSRMMGETVAQTICGNPFPYNPGPWFNSAKFFDLEYQTYGRVWPETSNTQDHLHWEHADGKKAVTMAYHPETGEFQGINTFGIRLRHEVFDTWLRNSTPLDTVLAHLKKANFDPEFFTPHEHEIRQTHSNCKEASDS